jgi:hypothetical protein
MLVSRGAPPSLLSNRHRGGSSLGKAAWAGLRAAYRESPPCTEVKNQQSFTSASLYAFILWYLGAQTSVIKTWSTAPYNKVNRIIYANYFHGSTALSWSLDSFFKFHNPTHSRIPWMGRTARHKAATYIQDNTNADIRALREIQPHDPRVWVGEDSSCHRTFGHCDCRLFCYLY